MINGLTNNHAQSTIFLITIIYINNNEINPNPNNVVAIPIDNTVNSKIPLVKLDLFLFFSIFFLLVYKFINISEIYKLQILFYILIPIFLISLANSSICFV